MSEQQAADSPDEQPSSGKDPIVTTFNVAATLTAIAGPIISFIQGGHYLFTIGLCLIISAIVFLGAAATRRIRRIYQGASDRKRQILTCMAAGIFLAAGIPLIVTQNIRPSACDRAAAVSGADTSALQFIITVRVTCTVPAMNQMFLVEQLLGEGVKGTLKHSEYYIGEWGINNSIGQQSITDSPAGCITRLYYVISVTPDQLQLLQQSHRTSSGSYYGDPVDSNISKYVTSNIQTNHTCNRQS
jgi:hypothetical protein